MDLSTCIDKVKHFPHSVVFGWVRLGALPADP